MLLAALAACLCPLTRAPDQRTKQPLLGFALGHILWMPLDPEAKGVAGFFDGLDYPAGFRGTHQKVVTEFIDRLIVQCIDLACVGLQDAL